MTATTPTPPRPHPLLARRPWWRRLFRRKPRADVSGLFVEGGTVRLSGVVSMCHFCDCIIVVEGDTLFVDCRMIGDVHRIPDPFLDTDPDVGFQGCAIQLDS